MQAILPEFGRSQRAQHSSLFPFFPLFPFVWCGLRRPFWKGAKASPSLVHHAPQLGIPVAIGKQPATRLCGKPGHAPVPQPTLFTDQFVNRVGQFTR